MVYSLPMFVLIMKITLSIPWSRSLKDKRRVVRSLVDALSHRYNLSVSEVELQDRLRTGVIGISHVGIREGDEWEMSRRILDFIYEYSEAEVADAEKTVAAFTEWFA